MEGVRPSRSFVNNIGTPGKICTFPFTTATGTQRSLQGKMNCSSGGREELVGSSTILIFALRAGESTFQSKSLSLESFFMSSKALSWTLRGRLKALAIEE